MHTPLTSQLSLAPGCCFFISSLLLALFLVLSRVFFINLSLAPSLCVAYCQCSAWICCHQCCKFRPAEEVCINRTSESRGQRVPGPVFTRCTATSEKRFLEKSEYLSNRSTKIPHKFSVWSNFQLYATVDNYLYVLEICSGFWRTHLCSLRNRYQKWCC